MLIAFPKQKVSSAPSSLKVEAIFSAECRIKNAITLYSTRVAAGLPSPAEYFEEEKMDLNEHLLQNPEHTFFVRVTGDSMNGAGIHPGDLLIVDRSIRPASGRIVIAVINNEITVKKLFKDKSKLFLMPENPNYACIEIDENMEFMIWGVVTNVIHAL